MTIIFKAETVTESAQPTCAIRFKERADGKRIMQQLWQVETVSNPGIIIKRHGEWRDVECVGPDASDVDGE